MDPGEENSPAAPAGDSNPRPFSHESGALTTELSALLPESVLSLWPSQTCIYNLCRQPNGVKWDRTRQGGVKWDRTRQDGVKWDRTRQDGVKWDRTRNLGVKWDRTRQHGVIYGDGQRLHGFISPETEWCEMGQKKTPWYKQETGRDCMASLSQQQNGVKWDRRRHHGMKQENDRGCMDSLSQKQNGVKWDRRRHHGVKLETDRDCTDSLSQKQNGVKWDRQLGSDRRIHS